MRFLRSLLLGACIIHNACATWVIYFSGPNEPNNSRHAYFYSVTAAVAFAMGLHANGLTVDIFSWVPCNWFRSAAYDGDGQRHTYVKKDKKYVWDEPGMKEIFDDLSQHVEFIQEGGKVVFTDLEVAEKFKSIFEDIAVADLRVALLWAARTGVQKTSKAGDDECNRHVIRHYHKKGEPHKAIEYCLDQIETRLANGGTFLHDTIKTHGALTTQLLAELQRLAAAAPGDAAAEGQTDETGAATPSTATSTSHFIPGTMKTNDIGTLKSMIEFLRAQGDKPQAFFSFEAETGDESLRTIEVRMPTLKNVCAPWADRKLSGPESFAALACDTALVLAAAPDAMFYLPPRINDIFFWSTNQRPWLDVMILDEFIYQIDPHCSIFITGDKPKDDCVMGPSVPGEVRQNRSHVLLNKTKLLGVGFKSDNQKRSGQARFKGKTLADEIKALRGGHHVTVLVKQTPDSQAPPEYCVVTPPDVEQFAKVARMGSDTEVSYYQLKKSTNLKFVPVADAAQQLVDAYKKYSRPQYFQDFLVATAGPDDQRGKNLVGRADAERLWALAGYCVRSFPGAGKAQFEITYKYLFQARKLGRTVRIGCYVSTVNSMDPEEWERTTLNNNIESGDGVVATYASTVDIWVHYFLAKKLDAWRPAAVFSTTAELLARTEFSILKSHPLAGQFDRTGKGIFYVKDWKASSRASRLFDYRHTRDAAALAEHHPKSQSQFLRTVVVSPSKDSDQEVERRKDLKRLFDLVVNEEEETPPKPKAEWLATPRRQY